MERMMTLASLLAASAMCLCSCKKDTGQKTSMDDEALYKKVYDIFVPKPFVCTCGQADTWSGCVCPLAFPCTCSKQEGSADGLAAEEDDSAWGAPPCVCPAPHERLNDFVSEHSIPHERVSAILETILREELRLVNVSIDEGEKYYASYQCHYLVWALCESYPSANLLEVIKKGAMSRDSLISGNTISFFAVLRPTVEVIPLMRELFANGLLSEEKYKDITEGLGDNIGEKIVGLAHALRFTPEELPEAARKFAVAENIPPEEMIRRLEHDVRRSIRVSKLENTESIRRMNEGYKESGTHGRFRMFEAFHGTNTLALLRECALVKPNFEFVQSEAIITYVNIAGTNAIPFLREVTASENLTAHNRLEVTAHLEATITNLTEKDLPAEAAAFSAFLPELRQPKED